MWLLVIYRKSFVLGDLSMNLPPLMQVRFEIMKRRGSYISARGWTVAK